jgi:hypothetical protein
MSDTQRDEELIKQATQTTAKNLHQIIQQERARSTNEASIISLPEQEELVGQISQIMPAGNVLNFIASGVVSAKDREVPEDEGKNHLRSLMRGLNVLRDTYYRAAFFTPTMALAGYKMLLRALGADEDSYLPEGVWQFYVEFGLREDSARHSNETIGFQHAIAQMTPAPSEEEMLTAWILAAMRLLWDYDMLTSDLWEEQVRLTLLEKTTGLIGLHRAWQLARPFRVPADESIGIAEFRRRTFHAFVEKHLATVGAEQRKAFEKLWRDRQGQRNAAIAAYRRQMSIRSYLEPGEYNESRVRIPNSELCIGIVYRDAYYLLDLVNPAVPEAPEMVMERVRAIMSAHPEKASVDLLLARAPRAEQGRLRKLVDKPQIDDLNALRRAPIIINWDQVADKQPLTVIRKGHRGIGDHALTLFRTNRSMVFDFSHIYFDGPWAMGVAEILTNDAVYHLSRRESMAGNSSITKSRKPIRPLALGNHAKLEQAVEKLPLIENAISAERISDIAPMNMVRALIARRTRPSIRLTINDLLVLYRTIFNQRYKPSPALVQTLKDLYNKPGGKPLVQAISDMMKNARTLNPSLMIPIDAERVNPKERIFPSTFRSPFPDFLQQHERVLEMRRDLQAARLGVQALQDKFQRARIEYLGVLNAFGQLMKRYRELAAEGQSMSTTAIRLIAGLPGAMQRLADGIPGKFSFVNEAIKGEEVFSNVGQVVAGSSLARFVSAKDDNDKKVLVWGIMTSENNKLIITLRDFRPPVVALALAGYPEIAHQITQDYLNAYVDGLHRFMLEITDIVAAARS